MTAVVYWMGNPNCLQQGVLEKHPSVWQTAGRTWQQPSLLWGGGGYHSQGALMSGWLTSYQGNQRVPHQPRRFMTITRADVSP